MTQKLFTKNFTLLVLGQASSLFGNAIFRFALAMYILEITGSATIFASVLSIALIPTILLSPLGGILADRANRRNVMVTIDIASGLVVLFAFFALSGTSTIPIITFILIILSILGAFESPTVQACVPQMQEGDNLIKANAVVNQIAAVAGLVAPILGSALYAIFGLRPVMTITIACFFLTAFLECFIKLEYTPSTEKEGIIAIVKKDFMISMRFMFKEQKDILRLLVLTAIVIFFVMGTVVVGLPYIIRNILGLAAGYYGAAESAVCVSAIAGSIAVGFLATRLKLQKVYLALMALGLSILPAGIIFILPVGIVVKYVVVVISVCLMQIMCSIFSIFVLSVIQEKTPNELLGKIMSYVVTITMCAQPIGQMIYGVLFDKFHNQVYIVLIPTAIIIAMLGLASKKTFYKLDK